MARPARLMLVHGTLMVFVLLLIARTAQVQLFQADRWAAVAAGQQRETERIPAPRGVVYDMEGIPLARRPKEAEMDVVYERCCGLDIHKRTVVACLLTPDADGQPVKVVRTFGTVTDELLALAAWLRDAGCTHVAMESTGVYWKPVWNLLEEQFALLLVNARHVKAVPGRKTDVKDAEWLADLLRHGLLRGSFVPDRPQRELRELTRYRGFKGGRFRSISWAFPGGGCCVR